MKVKNTTIAFRKNKDPTRYAGNIEKLVYEFLSKFLIFKNN